MNDVTWRSMEDDETWDLLRKFPDNTVLVQTETCFDVCSANCIDDDCRYGPFHNGRKEKVKRIAFIE